MSAIGVPVDEWVNEPTRWADTLDTLSLTTDAGTDFWRTTSSGVVRDNGHFRGRRVFGDFVAEAKVRGGYADEHDQAGLMVRLDAERWVKTGVELVGGRQHLSAVVTHAVSDWSVAPLRQPGADDAAADVVALRLTRVGDALTIEYAVDGRLWRRHRLAFFPATLPVLVGPMACSPEGPGFDVDFTAFRVDPL